MRINNRIGRISLSGTILPVLIVIYAFLSLDPYFTWETYKNGVFRAVCGIPYRTIVGLICMIVWLCCTVFHEVRITKHYFLCGASVLLVAATIICLPVDDRFGNIFSFTWLPYIVCAIILTLPNDIKKRTYTLYLTIFAITLILPILFYLLRHLGVSVPFTILEPIERIKVIRGHYYKVYPFAVQRASKYIAATVTDLKLCGIYDESGKVGTLCGLFLTAEEFRLKGNWKNILLLIGGVLTFSLAFYAFVIIYYTSNAIYSKNIKFFIALGFIVAFYLMFMRIDFKNEAITQFQSRFNITTSGLAGDNRTNEVYDSLIDSFNKSDSQTLLFGHGTGAISKIQNEENIDGSSYKNLIFNFGYMGFFLIILWYVWYLNYEIKGCNQGKSQIVTMVVAYIANIYQRPTTFFLGYFLILVGGIALIKCREFQEYGYYLARKRGY